MIVLRFGVARSMGHSFDSDGISVIPCSGKNNLDRPLVIFRQLGIPIYIVWDGDHGGRDARPEDNRRLLKLLGQAEEDWPALTADSHACFKSKLEATLSDELGTELFNRLLSEGQVAFGIPKEHATKNPMVIQYVIEGRRTGKVSATMKTSSRRLCTQTDALRELTMPKKLELTWIGRNGAKLEPKGFLVRTRPNPIVPSH